MVHMTIVKRLIDGYCCNNFNTSLCNIETLIVDGALWVWQPLPVRLHCTFTLLQEVLG